MAWLWNISTGECFYPNGSTVVGVGYAGNGPDLNNVDSQHIVGHGPIPEGLYTLAPLDAVHVTTHGVTLHDSCALIPDPANVMYGRSGFRLHGRKSLTDLSASDGCPILDHASRMFVMTSADRQFRVLGKRPA